MAAENNYKELDQERVKAAVKEFLLAIGEDPEREGLLDTPDRVARACVELFGGMQEDPAAHLRKQFHEEGNKEMVIVRDIPFSSTCEHHILPFVGKAHVCYIPQNGRITGLSKIAPYRPDCRRYGRRARSLGRSGCYGGRAHLHEYARH